MLKELEITTENIYFRRNQFFRFLRFNSILIDQTSSFCEIEYFISRPESKLSGRYFLLHQIENKNTEKN